MESMISIIICSRTKTIVSDLSVNIKNTIGCDFELIIIDNSENKYSIFEAYNLGISKSIGDFLCFMHDDVLIHTQNWGIITDEIFKSNSAIGLIGVAGAKIKTKMPSAWWDCESKYKRMSLTQHFSNGEIKDWVIGWENATIEEVVAIDGVFMLARKVEEIAFNRKFKGFHNYDLNLSFEYLKKGYKIMVTKDILLEHFSIGKLDLSWYSSTIQIHRMYKDLLPLTTIKMYGFENQEFKNGSRFVDHLLKHKILKDAIAMWIKLVWLKPISKFHLRFIKKIVKICLP